MLTVLFCQVINIITTTFDVSLQYMSDGWHALRCNSRAVESDDREHGKISNRKSPCPETFVQFTQQYLMNSITGILKRTSKTNILCCHRNLLEVLNLMSVPVTLCQN